MNQAHNLHILTAGYSIHRKVFHILEPEGLDHFLIRLQSSGKCRARINGRLELLEPGDLLLFAPEEPYELKIDAEPQGHHEDIVSSSDYYIFLAGEWIESWWRQQPRPNKIKIPLSEGILGAFRQVMLEQQRVDNPSPEIAEYYIKILCMEIDRNLLQQPLAPYRIYLAHRMKNYIEENASSPLTLEEIAAHVGISVSRAVHLY